MKKDVFIYLLRGWSNFWSNRSYTVKSKRNFINVVEDRKAYKFLWKGNKKECKESMKQMTKGNWQNIEHKQVGN